MYLLLCRPYRTLSKKKDKLVNLVPHIDKRTGILVEENPWILGKCVRDLQFNWIREISMSPTVQLNPVHYPVGKFEA